jgi:hypothetical protein
LREYSRPEGTRKRVGRPEEKAFAIFQIFSQENHGKLLGECLTISLFKIKAQS